MLDLYYLMKQKPPLNKSFISVQLEQHDSKTLQLRVIIHRKHIPMLWNYLGPNFVVNVLNFSASSKAYNNQAAKVVKVVIPSSAISNECITAHPSL